MGAKQHEAGPSAVSSRRNDWWKDKGQNQREQTKQEKQASSKCRGVAWADTERMVDAHVACICFCLVQTRKHIFFLSHKNIPVTFLFVVHIKTWITFLTSMYLVRKSLKHNKYVTYLKLNQECGHILCWFFFSPCVQKTHKPCCALYVPHCCRVFFYAFTFSSAASNPPESQHCPLACPLGFPSHSCISHAHNITPRRSSGKQALFKRSHAIWGRLIKMLLKPLLIVLILKDFANYSTFTEALNKRTQ